MENRRTLHQHRHKVKNTRKPYKPDKKELEDRIKGQEKIGRGRGWIEIIKPAKPEPETTVLTEACVICAAPFIAPAVICFNCRSCQACGNYNYDAYANGCYMCGNSIEGPRLDTDMPIARRIVN